MRIAFLNPAAELGGAERCLLDLIASLREAVPGAAFLLVTPEHGPLVERARALGAETAVLPMPASLSNLGDSGFERNRLRDRAIALARLGWAGLAAIRSALALGRTIRDWRPDVVHSNGMKYHLLAALAPCRGAPVVWHIRDLLGQRPFMARALSLASGRVAGALAVSHLAESDLRAQIPDLAIVTVYDAIDLTEFSPGPGDGGRLDDLARLPPAAPGTVRFGLVATYARWKGHELFLEAAARLQDRVSALPARFFIVGGPIYRTRASQFTEDELRTRARSLGLSDAVGFVPFQPEPAWVIRALDVIVHASTQPEPFGRTIAEGLACGRAVVAASGSGVAELLSNSGSLLSWPADSAEELVGAMDLILRDEPLRRRLGEAGRRAAVSCLSRRRLAAELLLAYRALSVSL